MERRLKKQVDWFTVWARLRELVSYSCLWQADQDRSLAWIATQLQSQPGVLIADEVGLGKTRLAIALAVCVAACGGRIAIMIPPGLTSQWQDDELRAFLRQLAELKLDWVPEDISTKVLRTYPDLFDGVNEAAAYPLSQHAQVVFLSHRFGLPHGLPGLKRHELWGLPFALKLAVLKDGRSVRNAKHLKLSTGQTAAVNWLVQHMPRALRDRVTGNVLTKVSTEVFKDAHAKALFHHLIGELIGDFDLIVIDEAHKSRAGSDKSEAREKQAQSMLQSRLSSCLDEILLRPGSASHHAKRLALTATPMEMNAEQWGAVFQRLGLDRAKVKDLKTLALHLEKAVKGFRTGSASELTQLSTASTAFQRGLRSLVTRRVWRDHPAVQRFMRYASEPQAAHPHRRTIPIVVALHDLSDHERLQLAYAEGLAAASRGITTEVTAKHAGSRHAQALPLLSELVTERLSDDQEDSVVARTTGPAEAAKRQRQAYWLSALVSLSNGKGEVARQPAWSLQWHPKVRAAIDLIEELAAQERKVLVFTEFLEPMRALDRALNIRHYLRQVRDGHPVLLPAGLKVDDPDLRYWLTSSELGLRAEQIASFDAEAERLARQYTNARAALREACQQAASNFFEQVLPTPVVLRADVMDMLVTWLVQQLCVQDQHTVTAAQGQRNHMYALALARLHDLQDADPAGKTAADDARAGRAFDWEAVIREQAEELETDQSGRYIFRMNPFSQRLYGDTKPSTRRVRQSAFNHPQLYPQVLIGQSAVASEGLNLHRACRSVVLFHLDWNPGRIEQQIGRVDRQGSAWMEAFTSWERHGAVGEAPYIDIYTLALEGTYDAFRTEIVNERAKVLRSQLFGEILPTEQLQRLPETVRQAIEQIKIDFRPPRLDDGLALADQALRHAPSTRHDEAHSI